MKTITTLSLLLVCLTCASQKVALVLNLKTDSTYYLTTNATLSIIEDINGQQQIINTIISAKVAHKVTAIKDSVYEMEVQYKGIGMHMEMGGKKIMDLSSDNVSGGDMSSKIVNSILNKPFLMTISKTGRVLEVKNTATLFAGMFDSFPQVTEAQKVQFKSQMQQSFGDKAIKTNFQDAFAMFPNAKVGPNDKWSTNSSIESIISIKTKTTYTLMSITDAAFLIHGEALIKSDDNGDYKPYNGMLMRFSNLTGNSTTELKLDSKTCWITEAKINKNIKGIVEIKDSPKIPGGLNFPISIIGDMTVSGK